MEQFDSIRKKARGRRSLDLPVNRKSGHHSVSPRDDLGGVYMQIDMKDLALFAQPEQRGHITPLQRSNSYRHHRDRGSEDARSSGDSRSHQRPPRNRKRDSQGQKKHKGRRSEAVADLRAFQGQGHGQDIKELADLYFDSKTHMVSNIALEYNSEI